MRVLVLGGGGLIGSAAVRLLRERGDDVTVLRRRATAEGEIAGDRDSAADLQSARDAVRPDAVIDMVCYREEQAALAAGVFSRRIDQYVLCSTVDVYRKDAGAYPLREDAERGARASFPYAVGKVASEQRFEAEAEAGAFALTVVRPAATYLDRAVAPFGSYPLLLDRLRRGEPIILPGDGRSIWSGAHRDDVAVAFAGATGAAVARGRAYHVAGEELMSWRRYWTVVAEAVGREPVFVGIPTEVLARLAGSAADWTVENFQYDNIFDCAAAARDLGWRYRTTWAEGVSGFDLEPADPVTAAERAAYDDVLTRWSAGEGREESR